MEELGGGHSMSTGAHEEVAGWLGSGTDGVGGLTVVADCEVSSGGAELAVLLDTGPQSSSHDEDDALAEGTAPLAV